MVAIFKESHEINDPYENGETMPCIIESNPTVLGGTPVIKGTRIPVESIFELVALNMPAKEILREYPELDGKLLDEVIEIGMIARQELSRVIPLRKKAVALAQH